MNGKILLLLIVVAAVAVFAAYRLNQPPVSGDPAPAQSALLYPGLGDKLNTIKTIRIVGPGATLIAELARGDAGWTVINKGGYPAAFATIRTLLLALAGAEIVEQKTANPEFYSRLGVSDIDAEVLPDLFHLGEGMFEQIFIAELVVVFTQQAATFTLGLGQVFNPACGIFTQPFLDEDGALTSGEGSLVGAQGCHDLLVFCGQEFRAFNKIAKTLRDEHIPPVTHDID